MHAPFAPRVGGTVSADVAVPEHERVFSFYSRILTTGDDPLWREDLMNNQGMPIIGLGARAGAYADLPMQWMPHIQVADVAASVRRALELGASEVLHGKDDAGNSLWAGLLDPSGAAFGLIPVVSVDDLAPSGGDVSSSKVARMGCISWLDLTVADASAARDFYREVIGWSVQEVEMEHGGERYVDYHVFGGDGQPAAAVRHARGDHSDLPSVWMLNLPVGDLDESMLRVQADGGKVLKSVRDADGGCAYAAVQDPVGLCLALVAR